MICSGYVAWIEASADDEVLTFALVGHSTVNALFLRRGGANAALGILQTALLTGRTVTVVTSDDDLTVRAVRMGT